MIKTKILTKEEDLQEFQKGYEQAFKGKLEKKCIIPSLQELQNFSLVYGFYSSGRLSGGYVIDRGAPRAQNMLKERDQLVKMTELDKLENFYDLMSIWKNRNISRTSFALYCWPKIIFSCLKFPSKHMVGYATTKNKNSKRYQTSQDKVLLVTEDDITIFTSRKHQMVFGYLYNLSCETVLVPTKRIFKMLFRPRPKVLSDKL